MLKAFFISRCQSAYPFPDSRPDCSWTNSPLTVLLPPPVSYSVQTEVRVGWHLTCVISPCRGLPEPRRLNWRANCWDMRRFLTTNAADFVATRRKHVVLTLPDRMCCACDWSSHELTGPHSLPDAKENKKTSTFQTQMLDTRSFMTWDAKF